ncbi:unnamed protein product [Dibothriocephalus latus]|uniref:Uncharacterized protein n=1 Tax=Dibothriocephalus latus TaxID=60516 RepID=A0A3P7NLF1_DIBLA|nr:unnamed protein product [Dibothriocephalus latus]
MNDPYRQSAAAAAADLLYPDLSSLAAVGATLPQDWLKSLSPQRPSGSKWAQPPASTSSRTSVPMPSTSTSFSG